MARSDDPRSQLPGVDRLLERPELSDLRTKIATPLLSRILRDVLENARAEIEKNGKAPSVERLVKQALAVIESKIEAGPRRVINATGIILHTGLGRAPLSENAKAAIVEAAGYCDLEYDLPSGQRGDRQSHVEDLLCWLTGAEAALVVNNNAAALYLVLSALAYRKEVIVSRGQLIEIGGSFRLPEIMSRSGCKLVEVGTTNRTRIADYAAALSKNTALLLRAYPSNYRIDGFTESVEISELAQLAHENNTLCIDDLGGGLLWDWTEHGLPAEPNVSQSLAEGADLVLISGDKVIGGPQSGLILGRKPVVQRLKKSPLARVLRPGKLEIAALAATLASFLHHERPMHEVPTWEMLTEKHEVTSRRAETLRDKLHPLRDWQVLEIVDLPAQAGSGTLPAMPLKSCGLAMLPKGQSAATWSRKLRTATTPIIPVIQDDIVYLNLRTIADRELELIEAVVRSCLD